MYKDNAIIVNIIGGPGVGKSIITSEIFSELKRRFVSAEISPEYIKKKIREGSMKAVESQIYIFGKQQYQLFTMKDEVDVIVTDSPFIFCSVYDKTKNKERKSLIMNEFNKYNNMNYFILRDKEVPYEQEGRYQDSEGAKEVDREMLDFLIENNIEVTAIPGIGIDTRNVIVSDIIKKLNERREKKEDK
jgi:nicotinamide riboside kinase